MSAKENVRLALKKLRQRYPNDKIIQALPDALRQVYKEIIASYEWEARSDVERDIIKHYIGPNTTSGRR